MAEGKLTVTVEEAGRMVGISRGAAYQAVRTGELPSRRFGGRIVVPLAELRAMMGAAELQEGSESPA